MKMQSKNVEWIYLCAMFVILKLHLEPLWYENISKGCYAPQMRQGLD